MTTTTQRLTKAERNYNNNAKQIAQTVAVFRKTDGIETLVDYLAQLLTPDQFRMLFVYEFGKVELKVVFVDENGNRIEENN
jgi:hypothetical protein